MFWMILNEPSRSRGKPWKATPNAAKFDSCRGENEHRWQHSKELQAEIPDLQDSIDEAISILEDAYPPECSREDLAEVPETR